MKFSLVFENSNDYIEFDVINNADILEYFIQQSNVNQCNSFVDDQISIKLDQLLNEIHSAVTLTNSVMWPLCNLNFKENNNLLDYLDQTFLNKQHEEWVFSQQQMLCIDNLRYCANKEISQLGWKLHDLYPDEIRKIPLADAMTKLGFIVPYEEVNMTVHRLESFFSNNVEFKSESKWQVFENPFLNTMVSNNDVVNFSFGYTYVGRQIYNKWQYWDSDLSCKDHYNYETLEYAFQLNLSRPQTIPFSKEFTTWCRDKNVAPIACQIPVANMVDIEQNLKYYRTILYKNSKNNNRAKLKIH